MTKAEKKELIDFLTEEFTNNGAIAVCDFKGMSVKQIESLRGDARKSECSVKVVKNTLAQIAMKNASVEGLELTDTNMLVWGEDQVTVAKLLKEYEKANESFKIKSGYFDGSVVDAQQIEAISKLPGREELIGMLLSVWTAPMRNMASLLQAPTRDLVTMIDRYKDTK